MTPEEQQKLKKDFEDLKFKFEQVFKPDRFQFDHDVRLAAGTKLRGLFAGGNNSYLPKDWTLVHGGTGSYTITHNLGFSDYVVMATLQQSTFQDFIVSITSKTATSFVVNIQDSAGTGANASFDFFLIPR